METINLTPLRDVTIVIDVVLTLWFYKLRWYRLSSATMACVMASLIVG